MRADSGFYNHAVVAACRALDVRFSVTIRQQPNVRTLIEAIPEEDWTPIPYLDDGAAVAETTYTPFRHREDAAPVRLIVRRVKPAPGSSARALHQLQLPRLHHRPRRGDAGAGGRPSVTPRSRTRSATSKYGVGLNHLPSGRFTANAAWLAVQVIAHNLARWTARLGLGEGIVTTGRSGGATSLSPDAHPLGPALDPAPPEALALGWPVGSRPGAVTGFPLPA